MSEANMNTPKRTATAASVALAAAGVALVLTAITALSDWRWAALVAGLLILAAAYVLSTVD